VLVIDDESSLRHILKMVLWRGRDVCEAADGKQALVCQQKHPCAIVLCDIRMPVLNSMAFLRQVALLRLSVTVIMMSVYGTLDTAVECLKAGAFDYISNSTFAPAWAA
jgi:two-component system response regulator AtoC